MNQSARRALFGVLLVGGVLLVFGLEHLLVADISVTKSLISGCLFAIALWTATRPQFFRRFVREATAESLGAIRILTCAIALLMTLWVFDLPTIYLLPTEMQIPMGIIRLFHKVPGFDWLLASQSGLRLFELFSVVVFCLGIVGWKTKFVMPLCAFCFLLIGGIHRHYCHFFHTGLVPVYLLAVLAATPCGDGLSVDRWLLRKADIGGASEKTRMAISVPSEPMPAPVYGWARYVCWTVVALSYVAAGLSKLYYGGPLWFVPSNLKYHLYSTALAPMQFDWSLVLQFPNLPEPLYALMGIPGIYGEIAFGLVLFSKRARWILPPLMVMMHLGIFFFQDILFIDLILLQLIFVDFTAVRKAVSGWIGAAKEQTLQAATALEGTARNAAAGDDGSSEMRYRWLIVGLVAVVFIPWLYDLEFYPLSAWTMFSERDTSGVVEYPRAIARLASGTTQNAHPERDIPALSGIPYRTVFSLCNADKDKPVRACDQFFERAGVIHNRGLSDAQRIVSYEIQRWRWDFKNSENVEDSELLASHSVEVPSS